MRLHAPEIGLTWALQATEAIWIKDLALSPGHSQIFSCGEKLVMQDEIWERPRMRLPAPEIGLTLALQAKLAEVILQTHYTHLHQTTAMHEGEPSLTQWSTQCTKSNNSWLQSSVVLLLLSTLSLHVSRTSCSLAHVGSCPHFSFSSSWGSTISSSSSGVS